ncbi:recombinase family protein [Phytoactinopolyspora endophytica]|uniref:recombinase family protein n=1 Tax=Phytoactinopolyspora endophytica TaxID=1642495 RepID=UPI001F0D2087|nr:recombinase family protein [Phytoactinopolyspora endophytica]
MEEIERAARWTYQSTQLEHTLERAGVPLFAADEGPISLSEKRATQILVRRMKQGVGEWFLRHTLEQSWDGYCEHTRQGWNIGKPPYGYLAERIPHSVAAKREEGKTKTRLVVDPVRGPAVTQIYIWRHNEHLAYKVIAERLNHDLDRYPPPQPIRGEHARNCWTVSSVRDILTNPKYTGYMVWNRRATKKGGVVNAPEKWRWSAEPAHEPLVTMDIWKAVQEAAKERQGSRQAGPNKHPATRRSYVLRHYVHHATCNKRMFGKTRKNHAYYTCQPQLDRVGNPHEYADHPRSVYVREDRLLDCVQVFFAERVFGPDRADHLAAQLSGHQTDTDDERDRRIAALQKAIADLMKRQNNLLEERESGTADPDDPAARAWADRLRTRFADLEAQRAAKQAELEQLQHDAERDRPPDPSLLDALPALTLNLAEAPETLQRDLYDAFALKIHYDHARKHATIHATIRADTVPEAAAAAVQLETRPSDSQNKPEGAAARVATTLNNDSVAHVSGALPRAQQLARLHWSSQRPTPPRVAHIMLDHGTRQIIAEHMMRCEEQAHAIGTELQGDRYLF